MKQETQILLKHLKMKLESLKNKQNERKIYEDLQNAEKEMLKCKQKAFKNEQEETQKLKLIKLELENSKELSKKLDDDIEGKTKKSCIAKEKN